MGTQVKIVDDAEVGEAGGPMSCAAAHVALSQVTTGAVIDLLARVEGAALVLRGVGLAIDPIRVVMWHFRATASGEAPWSPACSTVLAHVWARAWAQFSARVDTIVAVRALATGHDVAALRLSTAQVGTVAGVVEAARRLADVMPFVRAHDMTYVPAAAIVRDAMRRTLARLAEARDGVVAHEVLGEDTAPLGGDGVIDVP